MKKIIFILSFCFPFISFSQTFNSPESVEYDAANSRWLTGQNGSGEVLVYNPSTGLSPFCSGLTSGPHGIEILGNVLYCCDGSSIKGFNLSNGSLVFNVNLGATFLNGLTSDGVNNLFTTDFSAKKIYRVNVASASFNLMTTTIKTPNGILYDGVNNRCVFVTWGTNAPIQAMSLADSTVSTVRNTILSNCDGIIQDQQGNWYVSSWGINALSKFDSSFTTGPVTVMSSLSSPADLGINSAGDSIAIPNSGVANNVVYYHIPAITGIENITEQNRNIVFPNPSENRTTILLESPVINGIIELADFLGRTVIKNEINGNIFFLDRGNSPAGTYTVNVKEKSGELIYVQKLIYR